MKNTEVITLNNITKIYKLRHEKPALVEYFLRREKKTFQALRGISLTIKKGEKIGIVGHNGSGKTTLLKILAGITTPSSGKRMLKGKVVSLIGLEAGFHPDLSGRENILINGMLLGIPRSEIQQRIEKIIRYADIGRFIDEPVYTYSQGMRLRVSLSVALHADADIVLLDEQLQVGDQNFKDKIRTEKGLLFNKNKTIIMASHNLYQFFDHCTRMLVMDHGTIVYDGGLEAIKRYYKHFRYDYVPPSVIKKMQAAGYEENGIQKK